MEESTDVDRMLARLGDTYIHYREFADPVVRTGRAWPIAPVAVEQPAVTAGAWNTGASVSPRLAAGTLIADPEAPGGRLAAVHLAEMRGEPILDVEADGRTPPAPVDAAPAISPVPPAAPPASMAPAAPANAAIAAPLTPSQPVAVPAPAPAPSSRPAGNLDGLFRRVSGDTQPPAKSGSAPLSSVFKRLS